MKWQLTLLLCAGLLAGCGAGSGEGLNDQGLPRDDNGNDNNNNGDEEPPSEGVTLAQLQSDIFGAICTQCHTGASAPEGLRLDSEQASYDSLVEQASGQQPELMRVAPGEPDQSYLVRKLEGAASIDGQQMPLGQTPLSEAQIADVRDWIANGAPREGTGEAPTSMRLTDSRATEDEVALSLRFTRRPSAETLDQSLTVYGRSGARRWLIPADQYRTQLDGRQLTVTLARPDTAGDRIELVLNDPARALVLDAEGRALDGDGNRQEGGVFRYEYRN